MLRHRSLEPRYRNPPCSSITYCIINAVAPPGTSSSTKRMRFVFLRDSRIILLLSNGNRVRTSINSAEIRSEEHTSELQSRGHLVCRLLLEKKNRKQRYQIEQDTRR